MNTHCVAHNDGSAFQNAGGMPSALCHGISSKRNENTAGVLSSAMRHEKRIIYSNQKYPCILFLACELALGANSWVRGALADTLVILS